MILSVVAALSLLRTLENVNQINKIVPAYGPTGEEADAVNELQNKVKDIMWSPAAKQPPTMLRWLRFHKMNSDKAEKAIRAHVKWRKEMKIDLLRNKPADPEMLKRFPYKMVGFARNGNPVVVIQFGDWDMRKYIDEVNDRYKFDQHQGKMWDSGLKEVEKIETTLKKPRKTPVEYLIITDLVNLEYRQLASVTSVQYILSMVYLFENHFPETVQQALMVNSDWVFETLIGIIKPFMQGAIEKLKMYPKNRKKWEKTVRRLVDPAILPYRYGGYTPEERKRMNLPPMDD